MPVRIVTLPGLRILSSEGDVAALGGRRIPQALLVYLAVERTASRESLQLLLWPDRADDRARHSLSQAIHELRRHLGEDCIDAGAATVTAGACLETDLQRFEAAAEGGRWAEALQLYGGGFLDGVHLAGTHGFQEWVDRRRAQVARLHRRARREQLAERLAAEDLPGALACAQRWAELDPLDDEAQQRTIELLAQSGRRAEALEHYERFRELLRHEELQPMAELEQLAATLAAARVPAPPPLPAAGPAEGSAPAGASSDDVGAFNAVLPAESAAMSATPSAEAPAPAWTAPPATGVPGALPHPGAHRARDLAIGAGAGLLVGAAAALLATGTLHAVAPGIMPFALGAGAMAGAATVALLALAVVVRYGPAAGSRGRARPERVLGPTRRLGAGVGFSLGVLATLSTAYTLAPQDHERGYYLPMEGKEERRRGTPVLVTRFVNRAGDPSLEPAARMAEDWVTRRLAAIPEAVLVGGVVAADTGAAALDRLAGRTHAELVLLGSVYREGPDVLLSARLVPRRGGHLPPELAAQPIGPVRAPLARPSAGVERLAALVAGALAAGCRSPECAPGRRPPTYEARAAWLDALTTNAVRYDWQAAQEGLRRAIALDSTFANAYTGLANSYLLHGGCAQVDSIGDLMEKRSADFSEYDLLYMRAMRASCRRDFDAAYQYRAEAVRLAPQNVGARWGAAEAAEAAGFLKEAERRLADMADTWYRTEFQYYTLYLDVLHLEGKIAQEVALADSARARLPDAAHRYSFGLAGLAAQGRTADLEQRVAEAQRGHMRYLRLAELYQNIALELEWHGHGQAARQFALRVVDELEHATPAERADPGHRLELATALAQLGRWGEGRAIVAAIPLSQPVQVLSARGPRNVGVMDLLTARGIFAARTGDVAAARAALAALQERAGRPDNGDQSAGPCEACEAAVLAALGQKEEALRRLAAGQARGSIPRSSPVFTHANPAFYGLWHDPRFEAMFAARD